MNLIDEASYAEMLLRNIMRKKPHLREFMFITKHMPRLKILLINLFAGCNVG